MLKVTCWAQGSNLASRCFLWLAQCFQSSKLIVSVKTPLILGFLAPKSVLLGYLALYCRKTYHSETTHPQIRGEAVLMYKVQMLPNLPQPHQVSSLTVLPGFLVQTLKRSLIPEIKPHNLISTISKNLWANKKKKSAQRGIWVENNPFFWFSIGTALMNHITFENVILDND